MVSRESMETDQRLLAFLLNGRNYPEKPSHVVYHETHISHVFVGETTVYKIKKPVDYGFLDFSTLAKRHFYCKEEVILNARLAGDTYLGVKPIYGKEGRYSFRRLRGYAPVEYAVKMRRIPEARILQTLINQGKLLYGELDAVGDLLARFHKSAPMFKSGPYGNVEVVRTNTEENFVQIAPCRGITLDNASYGRLAGYTREFLAAHDGLLKERKRRGFVREVHGDLHSQHVCLVDPPIVFDCIEFNKRFRITDVLEDIAFLLMDLEYRARFDLSRAIEDIYFDVFPEACSPDLLRFYMIYRCVVRGKIEGLTADAMDDEPSRQAALRRARNYYGLAECYIEHERKPFNPIVLMGVSGSGKSVIARNLFPDAVVISSDAVRKGMLGIRPAEHAYVEYGRGIYDPEMTERTYRAMTEKATAAAAGGKRVVVDATFLAAAHRQAFYDACITARLNPFFIHCFADEQVLRERIAARMIGGTDISDAHGDVLERQLAVAEEPVELPFFRVMRLDTDQEPAVIGKALNSFLRGRREGG